jgi:hypothetical protein
MEERQRHQIKGALLKCAEENEGKGTYTGQVVVSSLCKSAIERIEELEIALQRIAKTVPNSYENCRYLPESRLDVIGDICEEVLKGVSE